MFACRSNFQYLKIVSRSPRSVTVTENTHYAENKHFKQMSILDKKSYIYMQLATSDNTCNASSDWSKTHVLSEFKT